MVDLLTYVVTWASIWLCFSQVLADDTCNVHWLAYSQCMRKEWNDQPDEITGLPKPTSSIMKNLHISQIRSCLQRFACTDPLSPADGLTRARINCFPQLLKTVKSDLETCAQKEVQGFLLPEDEFSNPGNTTNVLLLIADEALRHPKQYCPNSTSRDYLTTCLRTKLLTANTVTQSPSPTSTLSPDTTDAFCQAHHQCKSEAFLTDKCEDQWQQARKQICKCGDDLRSQFVIDSDHNRFLKQYQTCAGGAATLSNSLQNDIVFDWLDDYIKSTCSVSPAVVSSIEWNQPVSICDSDKSTRPPIFITAEATIDTQWVHAKTVNTKSSSPETTTGLFGPETTSSPSETSPTGDTTGHTFFFQQFTVPEDTPEATSTTQRVTTEGNILGINNIFGIKAFGEGGLFGNVLNVSQVSNGLQSLFHISKGNNK